MLGDSTEVVSHAFVKLLVGVSQPQPIEIDYRSEKAGRGSRGEILALIHWLRHPFFHHGDPNPRLYYEMRGLVNAQTRKTPCRL